MFFALLTSRYVNYTPRISVCEIIEYHENNMQPSSP